ncbi:hypothetical protein GCM10009557_05940 [Virgisporangium ochraceum]|uniref:Uncharacterized protein n=1 Tax=Virgisporangium ochraceum TaxID=65505 RepID=A0A8J4E904_9ACTN|nr:hypothetical protein [Virgisporangium ochraceum]GIJ66251.1 hypothetical protein Voc01_011680 [Virgisporangium ochraceum]
MTTLGRYFESTLADAPAFDLPFNALPGVDQKTFIRTNIPAWACTSDLAATGTGVAIGTRVFLRKGDVVTNLAFVAGNTALATGTAGWHALYDPDGNKLAQSAAQGATAWAANTARKLALTAPYTITADGFYIVATSTTASTVQTLIGAAPIVTASAIVAGSQSKAMGFTFGSATGDTAPSTTGTQTGVAKCPLAIVT